jgi:GTPase SAR1 family protein
MLGSFGVGKTSLVARFVQGIFSGKYLKTVGVKIDKKSLRVGDTDVHLQLWDLAGEDSRSQVQISNLSGAAGYFLVADGTVAESLVTAKSIRQRAIEAAGEAAGEAAIKATIETAGEAADEAAIKATIEAAIDAADEAVGEAAIKAAIETAREAFAKIPFMLIVNKSDLSGRWEITMPELKKLHTEGWNVQITSAKTGEGVEEMFMTMAEQVLKNSPPSDKDATMP